MWRRYLSQRERETTELRIEEVGQWRRKDEPAQSVTEDLIGHQLRTLLAELRDAVRLERPSRVAWLSNEVEVKVVDLAKVRLRRR